MAAGRLVLDALNQRGNTHLAEAAKEAPHTLSFAAEVVLDGRTLERPVNYALVRIIPPAGVTIDPAKPPSSWSTRARVRRIARDFSREADAARLRSTLEQRFDEGGLEEAVLRALIYVRLPTGAFDERGFRMLKTIRELCNSNDRLSLPQFKEMLNTQYQLVLMDEERAIDALPKLFARDEAGQAAASTAFLELVGAAGALDAAGQQRLERVKGLLGAKLPPTRSRRAANV